MTHRRLLGLCFITATQAVACSSDATATVAQPDTALSEPSAAEAGSGDTIVPVDSPDAESVDASLDAPGDTITVEASPKDSTPDIGSESDAAEADAETSVSDALPEISQETASDALPEAALDSSSAESAADSIASGDTGVETAPDAANESLPDAVPETPADVIVVAPFCGDGVTNASLGEQCDNTSNAVCSGCEACQRRTWLSKGSLASVTAGSAVPDTAEFCVDMWAFADSSVPSAGSSVNILSLDELGLAVTPDGWVEARYSSHSFKGASVTFDAWHHYALCMYHYAPTPFTSYWAPRLFVDGKSVITPAGSQGAAPKASKSFALGQANFPGKLDELRVSTGRRYADGADFELERRHAVDASTTLLVHLDDPSTDSAIADSSSNSYSVTRVDGTLDPDTGYMTSFCK